MTCRGQIILEIEWYSEPQVRYTCSQYLVSAEQPLPAIKLRCDYNSIRLKYCNQVRFEFRILDYDIKYDRLL